MAAERLRSAGAELMNVNCPKCRKPVRLVRGAVSSRASHERVEHLPSPSGSMAWPLQTPSETIWPLADRPSGYRTPSSSYHSPSIYRGGPM
jgi:LSD1 subclass zinc finger protein